MTFIGNNETYFVEEMLERGFFPENLPPVFQVTNLHEASLGPVGDGDFISKAPTEACRYNASKRGGQRRTFTMPNPVFMIDAAIFFKKHKEAIDEHLSISSDTCSNPKFQVSDGRPLTISSFPEFHKMRRQCFSSSKYVVKTDISRFYHSIYTHAIPWALHGKSESKKDRKPDSSTIFGNQLDYIVRQAQDGQTVGIPVGPDFSRLISEIIGVAIDTKFRQMHSREIPMLRLVDDVFIGADNQDDAATFLSSMRDAIRSFELDINESKTCILNSSEDLEPFWPVEIRREIERFSGSDGSSKGQKRADFVHFLDEIIRTSNAKSDEGIIKFALRKIDELSIWVKYWDLLEPFLVRSAISFPHCWDYVARVVAWRHRVEGVDLNLWGRVTEKSIVYNARTGNDSEVTWALWLVKEIKTKISQQTFELVITKCGPFPSTLALDVHKSCELNFRLPKESILDRIGDKPMLGANWLLAYEADRAFGFKIKTKNQQGYEFFKTLYDDDVSFYNSEAVPVVFEDIEEPTSVMSAIESPTGSYEDIYDDEDEDDELLEF
ncbi:RNA-directed DNA polymerase [Pelagibius sp. Alg239-R121]|uniref:RNA-directed DNA polymerase n=1 Tax=Pelagibius sp. Alg239-R121 TaxID=2993448 RepID=UPI0024A6FC09|nr:RNA-directed DNA polymerase [Pelagibius sp. Alg239-R121]